MKRCFALASLVVAVATTTAFAATPARTRARSDNGQLPRVRQCRGVAAEEVFDLLTRAVADPAIEFAARQQRTGVSRPVPRAVACASKVWEMRKELREREEHETAEREQRMSPRVSAEGRHALSRAIGTATFLDPSVTSPPYNGPPPPAAVHPVRTPPLRNVKPIPPGHGHGEQFETHPEPVRPIPPTESAEPDTTPRQVTPGGEISAPTFAGLAFDGVGVGLGGFVPSSNPPDVNGRVGATQYVQWNNTSFAVFDKATGALLYGPAAGNTLFQSLGGACASHNDGDPVVSYDILAGRWVLSQFVVGASPSFSHQCVAVSVTGDATGAYYAYDFVTDATNFVDYPHMGVWPDGYYMTTHVFNAAGTAQVAARVTVFERAKMLLGQTARMVQADLSKKNGNFQYGFLPADLDSLTPPPAGEASFVLGPDPTFTNRTDSTRVAVTWGATPTIALTEATISVGITVAPCVNNTAAQDNRDCVPQPSPAVGADYLDNISFHYMYRLAYRNFGGAPVQESLVVAGTSGGSASTPAHGAVRWFEFRNAGNSTATPTSFQAATFDPDTAYRWLPSAAMDQNHNIALGYSKSSTSVVPGIYMTGRLGTDTVNTMGAETTVQAGTGVQQAGGNRWGDYSAMTLDPIDQCTFWYTNEYLKTNGQFNWSTRVATYKFPSCSGSTWGKVTGTVTQAVTAVPLSGVTVTLSNGFAGATNASGFYSIDVPAGSYTATAADADRNCSIAVPASAPVTVTNGGVTNNVNFTLNGGSNLQSNGVTISDAANGNNNGVVNANECVSVNVAVKNNGCANETGISATLTTTTPGVTVTQGSATYSDLAVDQSGSNSTPFKIQTSNTFVCGTVISLSLNLTYASGNKSIGISIPTCSGGASQSIPLSSLTAADTTQADRLGRDGVPSTCSGKACPGGGFAGTKYYKKFNFTNSAGVPVCYTVQINAAAGGAGDIESAAYLTTYDPANLCTNYLGDSGVTGLGTTVTSASYSFTVPASSNFVVVVNTTGTTTSSQFSGTVSGFLDLTQGPGACPACTPPPTPTISAGGPTTFCSGGSVTLTSSAASGNQWYLNGNPIGGATSTTYNATASGNYTVIATVAGCPSAASAATTVTVNPIPATPTISAGGPTTFCSGGSVTLTSSSATGNQWYLNGNPIGGATSNTYSATASGNYTVIVTQSGCSSAASAATTVTVNPTPATPTISAGGPTTFCSGGSVTLTSSSATGNQWYLNGNPIGGATANTYSATASGNYTVIVTASGCSSAASSATNVTVNPTPATPTISGTLSFCAGGSTTLTSSSASGNQWYLAGNPISGATSNTYVATAAGSYTVQVTASGCTSAMSAAAVVTVNPIPPTPTISAGGPTTFCAGGSVTLTSSSASGNQWYLDGNPIGGATANTYVATASGNYTVVVTASGCSSAPSAATTLTVNPIPSTPTISAGGPTTFCAGGSVTLTSSSGVGNQWYLNGNPIGGATSNTYSATASGNYTVVVTQAGCSSAASAATVVTVNPIPATPTISAGGPTTFCAGGSVTLTSSSASGNQWYLDGNPIGGATSNTYIASASGNYTVVVTASGCSSAPSAATTVTVNPTPSTPTISAGGPTTFCAGGSVTLTSSSGVGNQWYLNGNPIGGATSNTYVATASGNYTVVVTQGGCPSAASAATVVTVNPTPATPTISAGGPTTFCAGGSVTLTSSSASGNQWYLDGNPIGGATLNTFSAGASGNYTVVVTQSGCSSAASAPTTVVVNPTPSTPTISAGGPTTFCAGGSVTLTSSSGVGNQWYLNGNPIGGATANTYNATASGSYTVVVTQGGCPSAASAATVVTVNPTPATPTISAGGPTTFCAGGSVTLTSSSASGNQWYLDGNPIGGATLNTFSAGASGNYTVVVTASGCSSAPSAATTVTVNPTPSTPTISAGGPTTFCAGGSVTLTSSSGVGNQWYLNGNPIGGATSNTYSATASGNYTVVVTQGGCPSAASAATVVTVNPTPATPTISAGGPTTFCAGGSVTLTSSSATGNQWYLDSNPIGGATSNTYIATASGNYTVVVTQSGCSSAASAPTTVVVNPTPATPTISAGGPTTFCAGGSVTLTSSSGVGNQWYLDGNPIGGATSNTYNATASGSYTVVVTQGGCPSAASAATVVTVNPTPPTPTISAGGPTTFCTGGSVTLTSSSATGNQWYLDGNPIGGATSNTYNATASGNYTVVVTQGGCSSAASAPTTVTVNPIPATPTITPGGPTTFCTGGSVTLTSSSATGNQWYLDGNPIGGATSNTYIATASGNYTVIVTSGGCSSAASAATTVTVNPVPATPTISAGGPTTFCTGGSVTLTSSSATGNQWYLNGNPIGGATSNTYVATASGNYTVVVTTGGCSSAASAPTTVTVNPVPATPTISAGGPTTFCTGGSVTLTSSSATGNQWYLDGNPIGGATSNTYNATASGNYTVVVTSGGCSSAASAPTTVTVNPIPATPTISAGGPTTFCTGGSVTLTSSSATGNQWYLDGNPIGGATSNTYNATASGNYTVVVTTGSCSSAASAATTVTVNPVPTTPTITPGGPTTFCAGGSVTLTSSSATGNQWYLDGNPIGGATSNTYVATASGNYTVVVTTGGCSSAASAATTVTVNPIPATPTISAGGPTTFCAGGSVTLTSSSASGNQWYLNGNPIGGATSQQYIANASGNYTVVVTTGGCSSAASAATTVTVNPIPATPTISAGGPTTFCAGGSVTLTSSSATGNQWYLDGNPIGGATSNTYVATASGNYTVVVTTGGCASAASAATTVTVNPIPATPTISAGGPTTFCTGGSVTLTSSSATGNQWYLDGNPIGGATSNTYVATASGNYTVVVTTGGCSSAASAATTVTVNPIPATPTISAGGPTTFCAGGSVTLTSSSATGNQWYLDGNPIGGATSNTYNATASGNYTVVVTTGGCSSAASAATTVTVNPIPATPTISAGGPTTFCAGGSVTLTSSSATGNQWYLDGNPIGGATSNTYSATASGNYTVVVTTGGCASAASAATTVTVNPVPATPTISAGGPTTFCAGGSVTLTSSSASGNQWYLDGNPIGGATSSTYSATASGNYTVVVTTGGCSSAASAATTVTVNPVPATPTISAGGPTTFCTGGSVTLTSSSASGNQWYLNGNPIGGATSNTYNATASGNYTVVVTTGGCSSAASAATTVTVNPIPATPTISAGGPTTFCAGGSVTLTSSSASGNQWYLDGNPIGGATSNTYNATASGSYTVVVTTGGCSSAASAPTTVTVNPIPATPTISAGGPTTFCAGGSVTLTSSSATGNQWYLDGNPIGGATSNTYSATASGNYTVVVTTGGCSSAASAATTVTVNPIPATPTISAGGPTTFCAGGSVTLTSSSATGNQWYLDGNPIGGATSNTYNATASGNYTVVVTTGGCSSAASAATTVTVNPIPATPTISAGGPTTFCTGGSVTLTSSSASGNQWYLNGNLIGGATSNTYSATASGNYTVVVTSGGCSSAASAPTTVTVNPVPATPTITPGGPTTFCAGGSVTLTSSSASGNQWYLNGNPIGGATSQQYIANASGNYTVVVTTGGCASAASAPTTVTVNPIPATPTITPGGPTTFCAGGSVTLTSSSGVGNQWYLNGNPIGGATSTTYSATASGNYTVVVTTGGCSSAASAATTVTVNPIPATPTISAGGPTTFCAGGSVTLTSSSASGNQWYLNGNPIGGATSNTYVVTASGNYTVVVTTGGCSSAASAATTVTVNPIPATPMITPGGPTTFCAGGSVTLTSSSASGNQWYLNGNPIGGATSQQYIASGAGSYTVVVTTSGCASAASAATTVTVNPNPNATINAPGTVGANSTGNPASVANAGVGASYNWSITNGTITGGAGTNAITFTAGTIGTLTLNVTVTNGNGCSASGSANVGVAGVDPPPPVVVSTISPSSGPIAGGQNVTITGNNFMTGATVTFGGSAATNVVVVNTTTITAKTPAHAAGAVNVTVTNPDTTTGTKPNGYTFYGRRFDPNNDDTIDPADIFYLVNYLFLGGPAPQGPAGMLSGDANDDGVVDPADIFYTVNYLFLGGPQPAAEPNRIVTTGAATLSGGITLGEPFTRNGKMVVPVVVDAAPGSEVPQAISLNVRFAGGRGDAVIHRAGAAAGLEPAFEVSRASGATLAWLVAFGDRAPLVLDGQGRAVVAEIELTPRLAGRLRLDLDPRLTMFGNNGGTRAATAGNGRLRLLGVTVESDGANRGNS